jgi:hypothetical protein
MPPVRRYKWVGPGYVETMGNRLIAGRLLTWEDAYRRAPVVMVSESLAREYFATPPRRSAAACATRPAIRGARSSALSATTAMTAWRDRRPPRVLAAHHRRFLDTETFVRATSHSRSVPSRRGSAGFMGELQRAVWSVNPNLPVANVQSLAEIRARSMAQTSFALTMLAIAAVVALLLGLVGIYGVVAFIAAQRTREIGVRMALGARPADIRTLFVAHGLKLVIVGVALGVVGAMALTRVLSVLFYGVGALDAPTYAAVATGLGAVALVATYLPARRAARVDPVIALRTDA